MASNILNFLYDNQDIAYRDFQSRLIPNIAPESVIGVRTPILRKLAKDMVKSGQSTEFLSHLPHKFFEENQLHAFILSEIRDFDTVIRELERFLPYIDNWATCDQLSPIVFRKNKEPLLKLVKTWVKSKHVFTVRFGVKTLMQYWLDEDFDKEYSDIVANIKSKDYYVNMMCAWYFATLAAKHFDDSLPYFKMGCIDEWTRLHALQKAQESYRISIKQKQKLRSLK